MLSATITTRHSSPPEIEIDEWENIITAQVEYQGSARKIVLESDHEGGVRFDALVVQLKELDPESEILITYTTNNKERMNQTALKSDKELRDVIELHQPIPKLTILNLSHLESQSNHNLLSTRNLDIEYPRIEYESGLEDELDLEDISKEYKSERPLPPKDATPYFLNSSISQTELDTSFLVVPPPSIPQQTEKNTLKKEEPVDTEEATDDWIPKDFTKSILDGMGEAVDLFGGVVLLGVTVLFAWMLS
ncbi:UNVERIFIED_CONTAM: hypothetical protein HDU68_002788 [Siphonaria sp. JEL0065]|nr:hypothetical protein HDU68_002788 [Siphonaria sp. JEL0065]